jgi:hypothetical protein
MPSRAQQPLLPDASSRCGQAGGPDSGCGVIALLLSATAAISDVLRGRGLAAP